MPAAALVPVPPRVAVWFGLSYRFGIPAPAALAAPASPPAPRRQAPPAKVTLRGLVTTTDGSVPPGVRVFLNVDESADRSPVPVEADGRFVLSEKAGQSISVHAEAPGYQSASQTIAVPNQDPPGIILTLAPDLPHGQIRGLVRSLEGIGLDAQIHVEPPGQIVNADQGRFEVDVVPGTYEVTVEVRGYQTQRRRVQVEPDGVTLLNVDLQAKR
jgi:carboxypeptidase family protein